MMPDFPLGQTLDFKFTTRQFSSGAPFLLAGSPVVEVYEDDDIAQIVVGETLTENFDGIAGLNNLRIVATSGNGYEAGKSYAAILSVGTVDGVSVVGEVVAQFSIERSPGLRPTTAGRTIDVLATGEVPIDFDTSIGTLDAAQIGTAAITAAKFGAGAIDAAALATDAVDEIADGVWDELMAGHVAADSAGLVLNDWQDGGRLDLLLDAIKVPTDQMVFTVANQLDINVQYWDDVIVSTALETAADVADAVWDEVLTGGSHNVADSAGRRLRDLQEFGVYEGGAIWIDTVNGAAGTTTFESGTAFNPVDNLADANTLATAVNLVRFAVAPASSLTFVGAQANQEFMGDGWTVALGGQSIAGSTFRGADVSGVSTGEPHEFHDCHLGACTLAGGELKDCGLEDTITLSAAVVYRFTNCYHSEVGAASTIDFDAGGATEVHIHNWHGNLTILNMGAGDILHFTSADGSLTMDSTCTGGTRNSAGTFGLTDNSSGMTVNDLGQMYQRVGAPVGADISADIAAIPTTAMRGTDSAALASVCTEPRLAELDAANLPTDISNLNDVSIADILASQLTESYAADGVAPTLSQALFLIQQILGDFSIAGTTLTVREIDGVATAATFTLDDAAAPTDLTRAT